MTETPTDKKLSERFAMAAFAPGLVERGRAIGKIRDEVAAALSELAKLRAAEAHPDATARAVEAFTALRWYRPHSLIAAPEATPIVALFQHGDVRCVFVNERDWIMVEMAIAALFLENSNGRDPRR